MPWEERKTMSLREEFVLRAVKQEKSIAALCREYDISRPTAYKWIARYESDSYIGFEDLSRRPLTSPSRIEADIETLILEHRDKFPAWGGRKLRHYLLRKGYLNLPCEATFNRILARHHKISKEASEKRKHFIRFERATPNELWQMDFKGYFKIASGQCHPLTVLDDYSRFSLCLKGCLSENTQDVRHALIEAFREYGLPEAMTMDNGSPWKGSPPWHLSTLTVWLIRLGIKIGHSSPRHPQTQGKDERFHRSLKDEVLKFHQFSSLQEAQEQFDIWRQVYNHERPHEGIGLACPGDRYQRSSRIYPEVLPPLEYKETDEVRKVESSGLVNFKGARYYLGEHLRGELVGIREVEDGVYDIYFSRTRLRRCDLRNGKKV